MAVKHTKPWPKLSETLKHREPGHCQNCMTDTTESCWRECDDNDRATHVVVLLCQTCADKLIDAHPRLYRQVLKDTPIPGSMPICYDCRHRKEITCQSPAAMFNGGPEPGLKFQPEGSMVHLCRAKGLSGWHYIMPGPVTACSGKEST